MHRYRIFHILALFLVLIMLAGLLPQTTPAERAAAASASPALLSQSGGASLGVAYGSGFMYVGMGPRLYIYNVSILSNPVLLGISGLLPDVIQHVELVESTNRVYVTLGEGGLAVFSTVNKTTPELLGTYDPLAKDGLKLKADRFKMWRARGAQVSETVRSLVKKAEKASTAS